MIVMSARGIAWCLFLIGLLIVALYWYPSHWVAYAFIYSYYGALSASLIAIALTVLLIDHANEQRDNKRLEERLIRELGSADKGFAVRAAKELRESGSLTDGSLEGEDLTFANLERAQLSDARLKGVKLPNAILAKANLEQADLRFANLEDLKADGVNLRKARLAGANLRYAKLGNANLEEIEGTEDGKAVDMLGASLIQTSLRRAKLRDARLEGCDFIEADFTESDLTGAALRRAVMTRANLNNVDLDRADLFELRDWDNIASIRGAKIGGVRNPPDGFREWAVSQGAIESSTTDSQSSAGQITI